MCVCGGGGGEEEVGRHYAGITEMKRCEKGQIFMPPKSSISPKQDPKNRAVVRDLTQEKHFFTLHKN